MNEISDGTISDTDLENIKYHANEGNKDAQYHLGLMYDTGRNVPRTPRNAEKWYKLAAIQGHAGAQYYLGRLYDTEQSGIRKDKSEAVKLYKKAAEQNHPDAMLALEKIND